MKTLIPVALTLGILWMGIQASSPPATPIQVDEPHVFTLEKGACPGGCPEYTLRIASDGRAELRGGQHFSKMGPHSKQLSTTELVRVFDALNAAAASYAYQDEYTFPRPEAARTRLTVTRAGQLVWQRSYYEIPTGYQHLESSLNRLLDARGWQPDTSPVLSAVLPAERER